MDLVLLYNHHLAHMLRPCVTIQSPSGPYAETMCYYAITIWLLCCNHALLSNHCLAHMLRPCITIQSPSGPYVETMCYYAITIWLLCCDHALLSNHCLAHMVGPCVAIKYVCPLVLHITTLYLYLYTSTYSRSVKYNRRTHNTFN